MNHRSKANQTRHTKQGWKLSSIKEIKKESYDQPRQHIKKQRHYFANKVCLVKAMVFPVVLYGYERWTIRKLRAEESMLNVRFQC